MTRYLMSSHLNVLSAVMCQVRPLQGCQGTPDVFHLLDAEGACNLRMFAIAPVVCDSPRNPEGNPNDSKQDIHCV